MFTEEDVTEALSNVIDPELGLDFVELGLVYDVNIDGGKVDITFTLTTPACPIGPQVSEQMKEFVGEIDGVEEVVPSMVFTPPWTRTRCPRTRSSRSATSPAKRHSGGRRPRRSPIANGLLTSGPERGDALRGVLLHRRHRVAVDVESDAMLAWPRRS